MASRVEELRARMAKAHEARREARVDNRREVEAEAARVASGSDREASRARARAEALAAGPTPLRLVSAAEAERDAKRRRRRDPDEGFSTYEQATIRQYRRLIKKVKLVDADAYSRLKDAYGASFYGGGVEAHGRHRESDAAVDAMVNDLEEQIARRRKYSRRRTHNDDADVDYINERNAKFNEKLERFFGEHTAEIKRNLERGTAI